ncbi:MAG: hypothetical protein JWL69_4112 [Phycisphaerales bacterium]|nr:hypothetical protein [Phycisphaerales bacterium]MDB5358462.1 hypothetical protein [Phycisphaerales bacterium]
MSAGHRLQSIGRSPSFAAALFFIVLTWPLVAGGSARAGNIFDDDWTPPKRSETPAEKHVAPVPPPPDVPNPGAPERVAKPPVPPVNPPETVAVPSAGHPPAAREAQLALPDKATTATCRKLFKEVFADQLKDRSVPARRKLAQSLLDYAAKTKDAPADAFVLLTGAFEAAEEGASLRLSFSAAEKLAKAFDVDESATKIEAATKLWSAPAAPPTSVANVQATIDLVDQLASEDDFAAAMRLESSLQHVAPHITDAELKSAVQNHVKELGAMREAQSRLSASVEKLKASPDDAAANSAVGSYFCFTRSQWEKGLPFLAKGQDAAIKTLAVAELRKAEGAEAAAKMADGWWDAATKMTGGKRTKTLQHAAVLYRSALPDLSGLRQIAIEKRLAEAPATESVHRVDLLDIVDPAVDTVKGMWRLDDGVLFSDQGFSRIEFPYAPPEEYDFRVSFVIVRGNEGIGQICSSGEHQFTWIPGGWWNTISAFEMVRDQRGDGSNPTAKRAKHWLNSGQRITSVVKVRKGGFEGYINDQLISSWKTDYHDVSLNGDWRLRHGDALGFLQLNCSVKCDSAEVIEITGRGKSLR